ncbi:HlyC/CorC family transporter [Panacagrimonas sp.]|uniref:HlyC/CorC family transporter n=1 Tax=Panacagrimonas sp. TaxID=2480088 RepID=UPI003B51D8E2
MNDIPLPALFALLFILLGLSAFFSSSETGLMTLNRYRLKTRVRAGQRSARLAQSLLDRPDRLIGTILLGNNFVNSLAAAVATVIGLRLFPGDTGIAIATGTLTLLLLIFGEVTPKTLAALHPERIGLPAAYVLWPLLRLLFPVVWAVNLISNGLLRLLGVSPEEAAQHSLSAEELRTVVMEAGAMIPQRHQKMLLSILDLEKGTVEDIMVPRNEIVGIDVSQPWEHICEQVVKTQHTRLPLFSGSIDELCGVIHVRRLLSLLSEGTLDTKSLVHLAKEPYYIPEGTPLNQQLLNFQNQKRRIGFVVDEYGDIQGLVTLEDILEEVVGEFTSDPATRIKNVYADPDGSYRVTGSVTLRSLNRSLGWKLPTNGPKTVNGLLLEQLESIPQPGRRVEIGGYLFEITETRSNAVKATRVVPPPSKKGLSLATRAA